MRRHSLSPFERDASLLPAIITGGVIAPTGSRFTALEHYMATTPGATTPEKQREQHAELAAARLALAVAVGLLALKFAGYALTNSSAIFSDALESIVNVIAAIMALVALRVSHSPADLKHPYGHGKAEFLSAATEGGMILLAAPVIVTQATVNIFHHTIDRVGIGAAHEMSPSRPPGKSARPAFSRVRART